MSGSGRHGRTIDVDDVDLSTLAPAKRRRRGGGDEPRTTSDAPDSDSEHRRKIHERRQRLLERSVSPERPQRHTAAPAAATPPPRRRAPSPPPPAPPAAASSSSSSPPDGGDDGRAAARPMTKIEIQMEHARQMKERALREAAKIGDQSKLKKRLGARCREVRVMQSSTHWSDKALREMSERDWRIFKEDFEIQVLSGSACPPPIRGWNEEGGGLLPAKILEAVAQAGYKHPSPVQMACIPIGIRRLDLMGLAETGSGKTCAFVIPMVVYVSEQPPMTRERREDGPYACILCPTRELARQIEDECTRFCSPYGYRTVSIVGGVSAESQAHDIRGGAEVVVGTPGRLCELLSKKYIVLSQCNYVILDEADSMVNEGMEEQVMEIFNHMPATNEKPAEMEEEDATKTYRVTVMFSSTMADDMERLAKKHLRRPVKVKIGLSSPADIKQTVVVVDGATQKRSEFTTRLREAMEFSSNPLVLVFCNTREDVETLSGALAEQEGIPAEAMHGGLNQFQRENVVCNFSERKVSVLVTTDILGRGIDIKGVTHVFNYDMPKGDGAIDKYSQRIGRTGRAGAKGDAISFVMPAEDEDVLFYLKKKLEADGQTVPHEISRNEAARFDPKEGRKKPGVLFANGVR
eukprot:Rhum_TRINITY_DN6414_c0_g1::Rhum_TRINITY_DN6414_c0_g1_i1::g.20082::m.20082/K12858/DDX23, PRP28; ATP-dependent RNA helicase DDX23/PRP28